jgi:mono/diheme cytochrome c family protein
LQKRDAAMTFRSINKLKIFIISGAVLFVLVFAAASSKNRMTVVQAKDGASIYAASCARCHGGDGRGQTAKGRQTGAKDFTSSKWIPNEARGIRAITNGKGKMPSFKNTLSAEEIRAVWNYVRNAFK